MSAEQPGGAWCEIIHAETTAYGLASRPAGSFKLAQASLKS